MKFKLLILMLSVWTVLSIGGQAVFATDEMQRQVFGEVFVSSIRFIRSGGIEMEGNKIDLDADRDTSITVDTDDQIDFEVGGSDIVVLDSTRMAATNVLNLADTDNTVSGTLTITPTYTYLQVAPEEVLTVTLATGGADDGDLLIIHNLNTTSTVIVDTGATAGGGNITIAQDDPAGFIFGDGVWIELFSPDNS